MSRSAPVRPAHLKRQDSTDEPRAVGGLLWPWCPGAGVVYAQSPSVPGSPSILLCPKRGPPELGSSGQPPTGEAAHPPHLHHGQHALIGFGVCADCELSLGVSLQDGEHGGPVGGAWQVPVLHREPAHVHSADGFRGLHEELKEPGPPYCWAAGAPPAPHPCPPREPPGLVALGIRTPRGRPTSICPRTQPHARRPVSRLVLEAGAGRSVPHPTCRTAARRQGSLLLPEGHRRVSGVSPRVSASVPVSGGAQATTLTCACPQTSPSSLPGAGEGRTSRRGCERGQYLVPGEPRGVVVDVLDGDDGRGRGGEPVSRHVRHLQGQIVHGDHLGAEQRAVRGPSGHCGGGQTPPGWAPRRAMCCARQGPLPGPGVKCAPWFLGSDHGTASPDSGPATSVQAVSYPGG